MDWLSWRYISEKRCEELGKTTKKLIIFGVWAAIRNEAPPEYKAEALKLQRTFSVGLFLYHPPPLPQQQQRNLIQVQ